MRLVLMIVLILFSVRTAAALFFFSLLACCRCVVPGRGLRLSITSVAPPMRQFPAKSVKPNDAFRIFALDWQLAAANLED